jgi:outer membrane protein insertion porin family
MFFNRKPVFFLILLFASVCVFQSCVPKNKFFFVFNRTSVKNPPKDTFVFANEIRIKPGIIPKDEQNRLEFELNSYWDDSVKARSVQQFGIFYRIKNPQRFDTFALERSKIFMTSYLQSQGYYNAVLNDTFRVDTFRPGTPKQQFRATPVMIIDPGKRLKIDSVSFNFIDTARLTASDTILQGLAMEKSNESLLRKGGFYSKPLVANELDRLVTWFRQNGYYRLSRENLVAVVDTTDQLIDSLTIDPFELARRIQEATKRRLQNPTADFDIMQATKAKEIPYDSTVVTRYHIGHVYYYPETGGTEIPDSILAKNNLTRRDSGYISMKFPGKKSRFHIKPFITHTYITEGEFYNERLFYKTANAFGQMGPWQQIELRDSLRHDTVDLHIFLTPYPRMNFKFAVELTRSTGDFVSSNNLFGLGGNTTLLHRNLLKDAIQAALSGRAGVELNLEPNQELLQTVQGGMGLSFIFPHRFLKKAARQKKYDAARAVINFNASYTERKSFYRLRSLTANFGDEWTKRGFTQALRPFNIELYSLDTLPELIKAFQTNPFLRTAFNTGSVWSVIYTGNWTPPNIRHPRVTHNFRFGVELAGYANLLFPALKKNFYEYSKLELEYIGKEQGLKNTLVWRGFMGLGYNYSNDAVTGKTLPFFKQFVAGGPNSMRAWGLRQLGLGRSQLSDTSSTFRDRFGDLQLEANIEYRFPIASTSSAKFSSALFGDFGNVWNLKDDPVNPEAKFKNPSQLFDDIAFALGTGLRMDVANFLLRVDFALKVKDPARREYNGWLNPAKFTWKNENDRNNYAFQIGIGLPF